MTQSYDLSEERAHGEENDSKSEDFVFVVGKDGLPVRTRQPPPEYPLSLELHPVLSHRTGLENSLLVSVHPPRQPERSIQHVPCDIVLVIDVSGSMAEPAPLPDLKDGAEPEVSGLSILDLTKHAARTILETLNDGDRLAIVTFSSDARIIQTLTPMTEAAKKKTVQKIEELKDISNTNLWAGIRTGLQVVEESTFIGNVQGIYVLTDGQPNHMCPKQGYVQKLAPMLKEMATTRPCAPTIHTFGFGYSILSNLLQSIAEVGKGSYAFIPDAGMIGTVFVHAVANLYSTYATSAKLEITTASRGELSNMVRGIDSSEDPTEVVLELGNLQYGQSRDNLIRIEYPKSGVPINASLTYTMPSGTSHKVSATIDPFQKTGLPQPIIDFHIHRHRFLHYLGNYFVRGSNGEYVRQYQDPVTGLNDINGMASEILSTSATPLDPSLLALIRDLKQSSPDEQDGQVSQALTQTEEKPYWRKWGRHYLPSLWHAHLRQQCNSFKDPGPLCYGANSPLFIRCRDELDKAFDSLPAPKPSLTERHFQHHAHRGNNASAPKILKNFSMSRYHSRGNPCFLGTCMVKVADERANTNSKGDREISVQNLRSGMHVLNPLTGEARKITAIVKTPARNDTDQQICRVGNGLWITPYHPVSQKSTQKWVFPIDIADEVRHLQANEAVYSILLASSENTASHAVEVGGISCVTLGHGLTTTPSPPDHNKTDVRVHSFFGAYDAVLENIALLPRDTHNRYICAGVSRDTETGLVNGFLPDTRSSFSMISSSSSSSSTFSMGDAGNGPVPALKQVYGFTGAGIDVGRCPPIAKYMNSSLVAVAEGEEGVWWRQNRCTSVVV